MNSKVLIKLRFLSDLQKDFEFLKNWSQWLAICFQFLNLATFFVLRS